MRRPQPSADAAHMTGRLCYLVGPSGAGKDSVLRTAAPALSRLGVTIARRVITRAVDPQGGDSRPHEAVDAAAFERRRRAGGFALHWRAHGCRYGIPLVIDEQLHAGDHVLVNGSRAAVPAVLSTYPDCLIVAITAPAAVVDERLRQRGREGAADLAARQQRNRRLAELPASWLQVANDGDLALAADRLVALLRERL